MKHIQTFESFLNEAAKNDNVITFKKFKDIDHTRLVKWMQNEFGMKYNPGMKWLGGHLINGGDFELDVTGWDKTDLADLKKYLKAQRYISESLLDESLNEAYFTETMNNEALRIYRKYIDLIDVTDKNAINSRDKLNKELANDEEFQNCVQKLVVQKALNWGITFAIEQER